MAASELRKLFLNEKMILSIQSVGFAIVLTDFSMGFQLITHLLDFLF